MLSTIQRAIAVQEDVIAAAKETRRSLMHRLFTYGPGAEPAPTKETEIGEIPAHWEVMRLGELAEFKNGINFKSDQKGRGILTVDVLNMYAGGIAVQMENLYRVDKDVGEHYLLQPGDILIVRSSLKQEGVAVSFPWTYTAGYVLLLPNPRTVGRRRRAVDPDHQRDCTSNQGTDYSRVHHSPPIPTG